MSEIERAERECGTRVIYVIEATIDPQEGTVIKEAFLTEEARDLCFLKHYSGSWWHDTGEIEVFGSYTEWLASRK